MPRSVDRRGLALGRLKRIVGRAPVLGPAARRLHDAYVFTRGHFRLKRAVKTPPIRIAVGALGRFEPGWVPTEIQFLNLLDPAHWERYFEPDSIDAILAEHVWEHLTPRQGLEAARRCHRYLKPGGYLRVAVPDGLHPDPDYIEHVRVDGIGPSAHDHKALYTYESLRELFERAAFSVNLLEYFDHEGRFHCQDWHPADGRIRRSSRFDERNRGGGLVYTSIVLDAVKPSG
jgi:predicted SAM-dependent methyltransferase